MVLYTNFLRSDVWRVYPIEDLDDPAELAAIFFGLRAYELCAPFDLDTGIFVCPMPGGYFLQGRRYSASVTNREPGDLFTELIDRMNRLRAREGSHITDMVHVGFESSDGWSSSDDDE